MHADFRIGVYGLLALASTIHRAQAFYIPGIILILTFDSLDPMLMNFHDRVVNSYLCR